MKFREGQQFENAPAGSHIARCYSLIDMGTQSHTWQGETRSSRDVRLSFELPLEKMTGKFNAEFKGKPFSVHLNVKQSLHPKATLRKHLEGWRGRAFTQEELQSFDPHKLLGAPCRISLVQNGDFLNIQSISPLGKGEKCPAQINPSLFLSLEAEEFDPASFAKLSEKTRTKIQGSPEYATLAGDAPSSQEDGHDASEPQADSDDAPF